MLELIKSKNILALSPHTDDIELGCGATLARFKETGSDIFVVNFSLAPALDGSERSKKVITNEFKESMNVLGAEYEMLNLPIRFLPNHRQEILDYLVTLEKNNDFDIIFCHSSFDQHQDHQTVQAEAFRAFKKKTILGYELPWNCMQFSTDLFVTLDESHIQRKVDMIDCYETQAHRAYMSRDYVHNVAKMRGIQIHTQYAECFELIRGVMW